MISWLSIDVGLVDCLALMGHAGYVALRMLIFFLSYSWVWNFTSKCALWIFRSLVRVVLTVGIVLFQLLSKRCFCLHFIASLAASFLAETLIEIIGDDFLRMIICQIDLRVRCWHHGIFHLQIGILFSLVLCLCLKKLIWLFNIGSWPVLLYLRSFI